MKNNSLYKVLEKKMIIKIRKKLLSNKIWMIINSRTKEKEKIGINKKFTKTKINPLKN